MKSRRTIYTLLIVFVLLCFTTCKKYPENTLWFKSASKAINADWNLVFFEINGNDSLNNNVKEISSNKVRFTLDNGNNFFLQHLGGSIKVEGKPAFSGFWAISKNKKEIEILFNYDLENYTNQYSCICYNFQNLFAVYNEKQTWQIQKLSKNEFWISTNYNGLKYELHFKK